ncbi:hypothetical protein M413DRAFT_30036 [Hebeloma cylindrosporum]|uniref:Major facilitator superfamily (MFS) profile domain-containing protein n=1 Tax=Hebeloma cylindrosporum TaxID=76867 RepID=A0A0C3C4F7_HEBCY|nr:hypothetical protein M413DRAFT_30036 [Hebeloma cylindrosporum h7]
MGIMGEDVPPSYIAKAEPTTLTVEATKDDNDPDDANYQRKVQLLNDAMQEVVTGLILPAVVNEFKFKGPFLKLGQNVGLLVGAAFWGVGADIWGRKISFNITLFITGAFALAAGGSPNYVALSSLVALWSVGVGGNLPVDSAIFLEFVPGTHQYLLTVLSIWWALGQLIGSLIAWPLIGAFSCPTTSESTFSGNVFLCPRSSNMGWRYFLFTMGSLTLLMWGIRFFFFTLYESPKYLMGKGEDDEAVAVLRKVAKFNGKEGNVKLTAGDLTRLAFVSESGSAGKARDVNLVLDGALREVVLKKMAVVDANHIKPLFATRKLAWSTGLLIALWALIGLAFPLYNSFVTYYLATRGADFGDGSAYITYRNQVILSVIGVPGALLAGYMVELPLLGRRGTLFISTSTLNSMRSYCPHFNIHLALTGIFILASTTARTSNALLGWNSAYSFTSNVMYGVLYALTPEMFPTKDRATGNALTASANRIFGVMAPIIALYADLTTSVPIFIAGAIFLTAGFIALLLPYEPRGRASL